MNEFSLSSCHSDELRESTLFLLDLYKNNKVEQNNGSHNYFFPILFTSGSYSECYINELFQNILKYYEQNYSNFGPFGNSNEKLPKAILNMVGLSHLENENIVELANWFKSGGEKENILNKYNYFYEVISKKSIKNFLDNFLDMHILKQIISSQIP